MCSLRVLERTTVVSSRMTRVPNVSDGRWRGVVATAVLLFVGSALPIPPRHTPDYWPFGPDKLLHSLGHAGLAAALVAAFEDDEPFCSDAVVAILLSALYGVGTELFQEGIPGREFERGDVVAGFLGSVVGALAWPRLATRHGRPSRSGERAWNGLDSDCVRRRRSQTLGNTTVALSIAVHSL